MQKSFADSGAFTMKWLTNLIAKPHVGLQLGLGFSLQGLTSGGCLTVAGLQLAFGVVGIASANISLPAC